MNLGVVNGFTIHANRYLGPQERTKLEELLAYGARGAFSNQRLSLVDPENPTGDLQYSLKRAWSDAHKQSFYRLRKFSRNLSR